MKKEPSIQIALATNQAKNYPLPTSLACLKWCSSAARKDYSAMVIVLAAVVGGSFDAAANMHLYVTSAKPTLSLSFGNPSNYASAILGPVSIDLGPMGTNYSQFSDIVSLVENNPEYFQDPGNEYGGPGDSNSKLSFATNPHSVTWGFDSEINNPSQSVGYSTASAVSGADSFIFTFDQPVTNVNFKVSYTISYNNYSGIGSGTASASVYVEGYGTKTLFPVSGGDSTISGDASGSFTGVAHDTRLAVSFGTSFYQGQSVFGDGQLIVSINVIADGGPLQDPVITTDPSDTTSAIGSDVELDADATGEEPVSYQWYEDGMSLIGRTATNLNLSHVTITNSGHYQFVVSNSWGSVTSRVATVTVFDPLLINAQPVPQLFAVGSNTTFSVAATGTGPLSYQWLFNGTNLPINKISTAAGTGVSGFAGDGGAATIAKIKNPTGLAIAPDGRLLIADSGNHRIRAIATNGLISTIAGTNTSGFSGDGGAATIAKLNTPGGVSVGADGKIFISDSVNNRVRMIQTNGNIATFAGNGSQNQFGLPGFDFLVGDGSAASSGNVYQPADAMADNAGNVFIADTLHHRVRKVGTNNIINTFAGTGFAGYSGDNLRGSNAKINAPNGLVIDAIGNLFIADKTNGCIRKVATNGFIFTVAGNGTNGYSGDGGSATNAQLNLPSGVAVDSIGNLLIADTGNHRIRRVGTDGVITTIAGTGTAAFSGDGGSAANAGLNAPTDVAVDAAGNIFIADTANQRIRKISPITSTLTLNNLTTNQLGTYQVIVTSPYGSVTSSIVNLSIPAINPPPLQIATIGGMPVVFWQDDGVAHTLQSNTNLATGSWQIIPALNWTNPNTIPFQVGLQVTNQTANPPTYFRLQ